MREPFLHSKLDIYAHTLIKKKRKFSLIYKEIQSGAVAKSHIGLTASSYAGK